MRWGQQAPEMWVETIFVESTAVRPQPLKESLMKYGFFQVKFKKMYSLLTSKRQSLTANVASRILVEK